MPSSRPGLTRETVSSFYKFFEGTEPWLRGPRKWWQKKGYFLMVGRAFQPVILISGTFGKKKITGWKPVPRKKAGPEPALLND